MNENFKYKEGLIWLCWNGHGSVLHQSSLNLESSFEGFLFAQTDTS